MMFSPGIKDVVNRQNYAGITSLEKAFRTGDSWNIFLLWNAGAEPKDEEKPKIKEHLEKFAPVDKNGEAFRPLPSQGIGIQHVIDYNSLQVNSLFETWTPSAYIKKTCDVAEKAILAQKKLRKKCVNRDKM